MHRPYAPAGPARRTLEARRRACSPAARLAGLLLRRLALARLARQLEPRQLAALRLAPLGAEQVDRLAPIGAPVAGLAATGPAAAGLAAAVVRRCVSHARLSTAVPIL